MMAKGLEDKGDEAGFVDVARSGKTHEVGGSVCAIGGSASAGDFTDNDRRADGAFGAVVVVCNDTGMEQECE